jgi:hypothetical protein
MAVSAAFAHTAVLAGRPGNAAALAEAGRHFGRIAHLIDAVEDLPADQANGLYNPLLATGTTRDAARAHCEEALAGLRSAVADLDLDDRALADALLMREVGVAVDQVFTERGGTASSFAVGAMPCLLGVLALQDQPDFGPGPRRRGRCRDRCGDCCDGCDCCDCCDCAL